MNKIIHITVPLHIHFKFIIKICENEDVGMDKHDDVGYKWYIMVFECSDLCLIWWHENEDVGYFLL